MLLTKEVEMKPSGKSIEYYRERGYNARWHELLVVKVNDLPDNSNIKVHAKCDICGRESSPTYQQYIKSVSNCGYYSCKYCNYNKAVETTKKLYGMEYYTQTEEYKGRARNTCNLKYGKDYPSQVPEIREKVKASLMAHYGVDNPTKSAEILNIVKDSVHKRYGVDNISQLDFVKEKRKESIYNNFGVAHALQSTELQKKKEATCIERFGVPHAMQCEEIKAKVAKIYYANGDVATSNQQRYLHMLFGGELNYPVSYYNVDICFLDENIVFEYDGGFHDGRVRLGQLTQEEFEYKELIRSEAIKSKGYKIVRFKSNADYLPQDTVLFQMLNEAKQYFSEYPNHSWIEYDIDNSVVRNAEYKDGISYDYGKLRKIKDSDFAKNK